MDTANTTNEDDKKYLTAERRRLNFDLTIIESDYKVDARKKVDLEMELRRLNQQKARLLVEIEEKNKEIKKLEGEMLMRAEEIKSLKKKMNLLK